MQILCANNVTSDQLQLHRTNGNYIIYPTIATTSRGTVGPSAVGPSAQRARCVSETHSQLLCVIRQSNVNDNVGLPKWCATSNYSFDVSDFRMIPPKLRTFAPHVQYNTDTQVRVRCLSCNFHTKLGGVPSICVKKQTHRGGPQAALGGLQV